MDIHSKNGVIDNVTLTEKEAMDKANYFLSYMPKSVYQIPPVIYKAKTPPNRIDKSLINIIPKNKRKLRYYANYKIYS